MLIFSCVTHIDCSLNPLVDNGIWETPWTYVQHDRFLLKEIGTLSSLEILFCQISSGETFFRYLFRRRRCRLMPCVSVGTPAVVMIAVALNWLCSRKGSSLSQRSVRFLKISAAWNAARCVRVVADLPPQQPCSPKISIGETIREMHALSVLTTPQLCDTTATSHESRGRNLTNLQQW